MKKEEEEGELHSLDDSVGFLKGKKGR